MKYLLIIFFAIKTITAFNQSTVTVYKKRPAEFEFINYSKISRSSIRNASVDKYKINEKIEEILTKYGTLKVQTFNPNQSNLKTDKDSVIIIEYEIIKENFTQITKERTTLLKQASGDNSVFYNEASGVLTLNVRMIDAKTNQLIVEKAYSSSATKKGTETDYQREAPKVDLTILSNQCIDDIGFTILKFISNWNEKITFEFEDDKKFEELPFVIKNMNNSNWSASLAILKKYTEDASFKNKQKAKSLYNYGLVLLYDDQFDYAKEMFKQAVILFPKESIYEIKYNLVEQERQMKQLLIDRERKREIEFKKALLESEKAKVLLEKYNKIQFTEKKVESELPVLIRTCMFRNIVIIDSIFGDCIDPECSSKSILKIINGNQVEIELSQLFKNGGIDVEKIINSKSIENLKRFQDRNSEEFDQRYVNSIYQNYTFKGKKMYDSYTKQNFFTNQIELRYIREEDKLFQFRTFVEIEVGENYQQGDGMLFSEITYEELLPYFAE
jgi:hypothetical protein